MDNQQRPDFIFNLAVPVFKPTDEEVQVVSNSQNVEPFFSQLLKDGYLTPEELAAFVRFTLQLSSFTPFLLDEFLNTYRQNTQPKPDIIKPEGPRIITP